MEIQQFTDSKQLVEVIGDSRLREWVAGASLFHGSLPGIDEARLIEFYLAELHHICGLPESRVLYAPGIPCLIAGRLLDWDTEILGTGIGSLDLFLHPPAIEPDRIASVLDRFGHTLQEERVRLLVHKTPADDVGRLAALQRAGFELLTVHLDYLFETAEADHHSQTLEGYSFGEASAEEAESIARLAEANYALFDRFHVDPLLPRDRVPQIYGEWARNSLRGYADLVWVARRGDQVVGFGSWGRQPRLAECTGIHCARYQLGAVEKSERGRGLFRRITAGALSRLSEMGETLATGLTNAMNIPAQRCFHSLGAHNISPVLTYRKDLGRA